MLVYEQPRILGSLAERPWGRAFLALGVVTCTVIHPCLGVLGAVLYLVSVDLIPWSSLTPRERALERPEASAHRRSRRQSELGRIDVEAMVQGREHDDMPPPPASVVSLSGRANQFLTSIPLGSPAPHALPAPED